MDTSAMPAEVSTIGSSWALQRARLLARTCSSPDGQLKLTARLLKEAGVELEVKHGERLPDDVIDKLQVAMRKLFGSVDHVAAAVFYAVTQPIDVNVQEIVIRPPKMLGA